jgi:predicted transcriptional regulator
MNNKKSPVKTVITEQDLVGYTLDDMLTKTYGPKGAAAREAAEVKINAIAQNLAMSNTLKEIREGRKKSQHEVANGMDVDDSVVSKLEKNFEKAQIDTILRYAKALKAKNVNIVFEFAKKEKQVLQFHV